MLVRCILRTLIITDCVLLDTMREFREEKLLCGRGSEREESPDGGPTWNDMLKEAEDSKSRLRCSLKLYPSYRRNLWLESFYQHAFYNIVDPSLCQGFMHYDNNTLGRKSKEIKTSEGPQPSAESEPSILVQFAGPSHGPSLSSISLT